MVVRKKPEDYASGRPTTDTPNPNATKPNTVVTTPDGNATFTDSSGKAVSLTPQEQAMRNDIQMGRGVADTQTTAKLGATPLSVEQANNLAKLQIAHQKAVADAQALQDQMDMQQNADALQGVQSQVGKIKNAVTGASIAGKNDKWYQGKPAESGNQLLQTKGEVMQNVGESTGIIVKSAGEIVDGIFSLVKGSKTARVSIAEGSLAEADAQIKKGIKEVRAGIKTPEDMMQDIVDYENALNQLEATNHGIGKLNLRYHIGGGADVAESVLRAKRNLNAYYTAIEYAGNQAILKPNPNAVNDVASEVLQ